MRAESLAHRAFFSHPLRWEDQFFAQISTSADHRHTVTFDAQSGQSKCSCPFLPKPCLHAQALALFAKNDEAAFELVETLPGWAQGLPAARQPASIPFRQTVSTEHRLERARHGFEDLEAWLFDTLRRGVATVASEDPDFFINIATRLADASLRGLSRNIRLLEEVSADSPGWPGKVAAVLGEAALALHAFRRRKQLPESLLNDLEALVGISAKKETVLANGERLHDTWAVLGSAEETVEGQLRQRRTWLLGLASKRYALLLEHVYGEPDFLPGIVPGTVLEGQMVFYPSAWPHRALASEEMKLLTQPVDNLPGFEKIGDMAQMFATALGKQPWLSAFPAVLRATPLRHKGRFGLADSDGKYVLLANSETSCWSLLALGGGGSLPVFGEWDGERLNVLSAWDGKRFVGF